MSRKKHWDQVYTKNTPLEVSWFQNEPSLSMQLISESGVAKDSAIIDIGGGASRLVDHLLQQGFTNLAVLDISASAIEHAQNRLGGQQSKVEWFVKDIIEFKPSRKFDCWHDRAVFHFLTNVEDRKLYKQSLDQALVVGGHLIIATFAIGGPEKCSGLEIVQYDTSKICAELGDQYQLLDQHYELHITPAEKEQQYNYFHFKKIK